MLVIRDAQMKVLGELTRTLFQQKLTTFLLQNYPRESRQAGGAAQLGILVRQGITAAAAYGFTTQREVRIFVSLMVMLGADFPEDLQLPWAAAGLAEPGFPDATARCEQLFRTALSYLEATAGRRGEFIVRALLRVKNFELAAVPPTMDEGWAAAVCRIWKTLYPEKLEYQGQELCLALIAHAAPRARALGMGDAVGTFVHATLMFFLGVGYASDPLQPWAAAVLHDAGGVAPDPALGPRLHAAALAHIEQSLTSD